MVCHYVFTGMMPCSGKLLVLNLLSQKSGFRPAGRVVAPIHVKLTTADGQLGPVGCAKLSESSRGECGPKYQHFPLFGKESPRRANH